MPLRLLKAVRPRRLLAHARKHVLAYLVMLTGATACSMGIRFYLRTDWNVDGWAPVDSDVVQALINLLRDSQVAIAVLGAALFILGLFILIGWVRPSGREATSSADTTIEERVVQAQHSMADVVSQVSEKLAEVSLLLDGQVKDVRKVANDLEVEFTARIASFDELAEQAANAEQRADHAMALAEMSEKSRAAVESLIDNRLVQRLSAERKTQIITGLIFLILGALLSIPIGLWLSSWPT